MKIAVVGSYGVGMTMRVAQIPRPGETLSGGSYSSGPGGKGSNQAIAASRLGAEVSLLTSVGPDSFGSAAFRLWKHESVATDHVVTGTRPTMVGFILVEGDGQNRIVIASGALGELTEAHVENFRSTIRESAMLIVSMEIPMDVVAAALRIAHEERTPTLLNPAPAAVLPDEVWPWIDVLTPNETEAPVLLGLEDGHGLSAESLVAELRLRTDATIVLTRGSAGALVNDKVSTTTVPAVPARRVTDTTGAGDSFTAALAVSLANGRSIDDAVRYASAAGSHAVSIDGVIDALPTAADIQNIQLTESAT